MTLKDIFKTVEGIIILSAFVAVIVTGAKIFAYLGLGGYIIANIKGGIEKTVKAVKSIIKFFKNFRNKE
jgi:branched-subunit amino acid ABC-type transport system permease component